MRVFGRKKEVVLPAEFKPAYVFGLRVPPELGDQLNWDGMIEQDECKIAGNAVCCSVESTCRRCGDGTKGVYFDDELTRPWEEVRQAARRCEDCRWYEDEYPKEMTAHNEAISLLVRLREGFLEALGHFPNISRPAGIGEADLIAAGLEVHRGGEGEPLGVVLFAYSQRDLHELTTRVGGLLSPFGLGIKFVPGLECQMSFPGTYNWKPGEETYDYDSAETRSYLERLVEERQRLEYRASAIDMKMV